MGRWMGWIGFPRLCRRLRFQVLGKKGTLAACISGNLQVEKTRTEGAKSPARGDGNRGGHLGEETIDR